jgi:hypothetical protein
MRFAVGIVLNAWVYGVPIVLLAWAALRLLHRAPARVRYVLVIVAFFAVIAMPLIPRGEVGTGVSAEAAADVITFPLVLLWTSPDVISRGLRQSSRASKTRRKNANASLSSRA